MITEQSQAAPFQWFKSSYSGGAGGECIEIAPTPATIHIRDSKNPPSPHGPHLTFPPVTWAAFLGLARRG